jgi:hypothetical protein
MKNDQYDALNIEYVSMFVTFMIVVEMEQLKELMLPLRIPNHFIQKWLCWLASASRSRLM